MYTTAAVESWPPALRAALIKKIEGFWEEAESGRYDYADNWRVCRLDRPSEVRAFEDAFNHGCCGSYEVDWEINGVKVRYGFNYGH